MIDDRYPLGLRLALHRKDLGIALEMARELGLDLPVAELTAAIEDGLASTGHADEDMSVLAHAIRAMRDASPRA
jgi:3-hydroxyisobutyrate dehydrogenase-like beta-hydroxyacid dehydrogenase